jgi:hypothetical protein
MFWANSCRHQLHHQEAKFRLKQSEGAGYISSNIDFLTFQSIGLGTGTAWAFLFVAIAICPLSLIVTLLFQVIPQQKAPATSPVNA